MISRNKQGEWRVSAPLYKLLLTTHIMASVGWLGVVVAKLALGFAAATTGDPGVTAALYASTEVVNRVFPPAAIATFVTGVLLSLGTKWGLLQHYWVAVKLVLTVAVPATAIQLGDRVVQQSITSGTAAADATILGIAAAPTFLLSLSAAHMLMLGAATVISVYKPWGKTWFGRRRAGSLDQRPSPSLNRSLSPG